MRSALVLMFVTMGLTLVLGMSVKKYNFEHNTDYSSWQFVQHQIFTLISSQ